MKIFRKLITVVLVLFMTLSLAGCGGVADITKAVSGNSTDNTTKVIKSSDGTLQLTVPSSWKEDKELNDQAMLQVSNRSEEKYVIVIREEKATFASDVKVDDYTGMVADNMSSAVTNAQLSKIQDSTFNNKSACYFELAGEVQKIKISYLVIVWQDNGNYYQTIGWTLTPKFESNKGSIRAVMDSLKATK